MSDDIDALIAAIERDPDDVPTYLVLADALQRAGDPRGELIQLSYQLDAAAEHAADRWAADRRRRDLIAARRALVFGQLPPRHVTLEYRLGFLDGVVANGSGCAVLPSVLASPESRLLRSLHAYLPADDHAARELLAGITVVPRALRRVTLERQRPGPREPLDRRTCRLSHPPRARRGAVRPTLDDLGRVLDVFPHITELVLDLDLASLATAPLRSRHLQRFTWIAPFIAARELAPLAASELPALESFALWIGARFVAQPGAPEQFDAALGPHELGPIFDMLARCPDLRELGLCNAGPTIPEILACLAAHPLARQLAALDLSSCDLLTAHGALRELCERYDNIHRVTVAGGVISRVAELERCVAVEGTPRTRFGPRDMYVHVHEPW